MKLLSKKEIYYYYYCYGDITLILCVKYTTLNDENNVILPLKQQIETDLMLFTLKIQHPHC